jgi:hypothetical protein
MQPTFRSAAAGRPSLPGPPPRSFRRIATLALAGFAVFLPTAAGNGGEGPHEGGVPNIVFVLADDVGG